MRTSVPSALLTALLLSGAADPAAAGPPAPRCHDVDSDFTSELAPDGCASPLGLCATGRIGHDPVLKGRMYVTIADAARSAGMVASEPESLLSVSGTRTLAPNRGGTLTAHVVGVFDTRQVVFTELNVITGGTGRFTGATGTLNVFGHGTSPTTFAGTISGRICLP
jgi:hypothetical protein